MKTSKIVDILRRSANRIVEGKVLFNDEVVRIVKILNKHNRLQKKNSKITLVANLRQLIAKADIHNKYTKLYRRTHVQDDELAELLDEDSDAEESKPKSKYRTKMRSAESERKRLERKAERQKARLIETAKLQELTRLKYEKQMAAAYKKLEEHDLIYEKESSCSATEEKGFIMTQSQIHVFRQIQDDIAHQEYKRRKQQHDGEGIGPGQGATVAHALETNTLFSFEPDFEPPFKTNALFNFDFECDRNFEPTADFVPLPGFVSPIQAAMPPVSPVLPPMFLQFPTGTADITDSSDPPDPIQMQISPVLPPMFLQTPQDLQESPAPIQMPMPSLSLSESCTEGISAFAPQEREIDYLLYNEDNTILAALMKQSELQSRLSLT